MLAIGTAVLALWLFFMVFDRSLNRDTEVPIETAAIADGYERTAAAARAIAVHARTRDGYPSLSLAVMRDGRMLWQEAIGYADIDSRAPATAATQYAIGSVSKPLTAVAAMQMEEAGMLNLDIGIDAYLPDIPKHYRGVTMRQLLSHQAGVRGYGGAMIPPFFNENNINAEYASVEEGLQIFINDPLEFVPDQSFGYSTYGYSLASRVMEAASGEEFLLLMEKTTFSRLSMNGTGGDVSPDSAAARARDYLAIAGFGIAPAPETSASWRWAGGGFRSTPGDLAGFADAVFAGAVLNKKHFAQMTTPRTISNGERNPQNYGLGWRMGLARNPTEAARTTPAIAHGGTAAGSQCMLVATPEFRVSVAICGNAWTGGSGPIHPS